MKFHGIKGIFFDVGWTLLSPRYGGWLYNSGTLNKHIDTDLYRSLPEERRNAAHDLALAYISDNTRLDTEDEEYEMFCSIYRIIADELPELGLTPGQIDAIAHDKVYNMENYIYFDDAIPTLETLRGKYRLGVISDTSPSIKQMLDYGGLTPYFDTFTYSCAVGVCKPDVRMYADALEKMGLSPSETIFIDDIESNLDGAADADINPVHITYKPGTIPSGKYPVISKISELLKLL